jgi:hypothetical protein
VKGFAWMIPGKLKLFALAERDAGFELRRYRIPR